MSTLRVSAVAVAAVVLVLPVFAQHPAGEEPALFVRVSQDDLAAMSVDEIAEHGLRIFTTPFTTLDGHGDGPMNLNDTVSPGGRPTLQGNGRFLRVNGLDGQSCLDCHAILSSATRPQTLGIGGVGTANNNAIIMPTAIDPADLEDLDTIAGFNGRFANPPFLFGAGGVELVALEMTADLQALRQQAVDAPGVPVELWTKGVYFGTIVADIGGDVDTSLVEGVEPDLVVRPFGRKGEFTTVRAFDNEALQFHFGMQPVEVVGADFDADGDGVENEVLIGELSALHTFAATLERPQQDKPSVAANAGFSTFSAIGCADCHVPSLGTRNASLPLRFPEVETDPSANVFMEIDLSRPPMRFARNGQGGVDVPLFSDLKRHDMGDALAEDFALKDEAFNRSFITARLWGIADTAPYLHDGRATTLTEAILLHGGEAQDVRDAFDALPDDDKANLLAFLRTLRTPLPGRDRAPGQARRDSGGRAATSDATIDFGRN